MGLMHDTARQGNVVFMMLRAEEDRDIIEDKQNGVFTECYHLI
jgi:hypothetical protein